MGTYLIAALTSSSLFLNILLCKKGDDVLETLFITVLYPGLSALLKFKIPHVHVKS